MKMTPQQKISIAEKARQKFEATLQVAFGKSCRAHVQVSLHDASPTLFTAASDFDQYEGKQSSGKFFLYCVEPENQKLIIYKK